MGLPADHRNHQRQSEPARARKTRGGTTYTYPYRQRILYRTRIDWQVVHSRAVSTRPGYEFTGPHLQEQVQLIGEQFVVILQPVAEERKGLDRRAAPDHHLRPSA